MNSMRFQKRALCVIVGAALAMSAQAQETKGEGSILDFVPTGGCNAIPDNTYVSPDAGTAGMTCIDVPGAAGVIGNMVIDVAANHSWSGDLTFKVVPPGGTPIVTLMNRPGVPGSTFGTSADLSAAFPISFASAHPVDAENVGQGLSGAQVICQQDGICEFFPNRDQETGSSALHLDAFTGLSADGTWQFCAGDSAGGDTGEICAVTFDFDLQGTPPPELPDATPVPTTGRLGLLAMLLAIAAAGYAGLRGRVG